MVNMGRRGETSISEGCGLGGVTGVPTVCSDLCEVERLIEELGVGSIVNVLGRAVYDPKADTSGLKIDGEGNRSGV